MNKIINLDRLDFHYWVNELPELKINDGKETEVEVTNIRNGLSDTLQVALELSLHKHISSYAMLGFEYIPVQNAKTLIVSIKYSDGKQMNYLSDIKASTSSEYIYVGLDKFFLSAVVDNIVAFGKENCLPAGYLNLKIAANCEVGSSPLIFGVITGILLRILVSFDEERVMIKDYWENLFLNTIKNSELFIKK